MGYIVLGLYKITDSVDIKIIYKLAIRDEYQLLAGDLHMHTLNSDGIYTVQETLDFANQASLDFIALTDHNVTHQNKQVGDSKGIIVISAMTSTYRLYLYL